MIAEGTMVISLFAFVSMIALDYVWAKYNIACAEKYPLQAACYAVGITLLAALMVLIYVSDPWMVIPQAAGSFVGTYVAVKTS